jgi:ubiquinone/menaquinone biosynthesis C-methylase UbiE
MEHKHNWDDEWKEFKGLNFFGRRLKEADYRAILKLTRDKKIGKVLEIGCGAGEITKKLIKHWKVIGIDNSPTSIRICKQRGLDARLMDAADIKFNDKSFDLVYADGLLEHFKNFEPFVKEMCKVSKKYVLITQPNHFSLFHKIVHRMGGVPVHEYTYTIDDFAKSFKKFNYSLIGKTGVNMNEQWALLFERQDQR